MVVVLGYGQTRPGDGGSQRRDANLGGQGQAAAQEDPPAGTQSGLAVHRGQG